jgi:hypothetical protein
MSHRVVGHLHPLIAAVSNRRVALAALVSGAPAALPPPRPA